MLKLFKSKKAQNTMEYALMIAIVIGVFSAMQLYIRRGMQSRIREGVNNVPNQVLNNVDESDKKIVAGLLGTATTATQYEPYYSVKGEYDVTTTSNEGTESGTITEEGGVRDLDGATVSRKVKQSILAPKTTEE